MARLVCEEHRKVRPADKFTLRFDCSPKAEPDAETKGYMRELVKLLQKQAAASGGSVQAKFLEKSSFDIAL